MPEAYDTRTHPAAAHPDGGAMPRPAATSCAAKAGPLRSGMAHDLRGKAIVITGAGTGIGRATAIACAREGMPVVLGGRRLEPLERAAQEIRAAGGRAIAMVCDVTNVGDCTALVDRCVQEFGGVYCVFANAGFGVECASLNMPDETLRGIFETNFFGSMNVIRPAVQRMRDAAAPAGSELRGHVILCSSCLAKIGMPYYAAYSASKAAQDHFARAMRSELRNERIACSSVHPIGTKTDFFDTASKLSNGTRLTDAKNVRFMQSPEVVANEIVKCLKRPRGEVWTALGMRWIFALANAMPSVCDVGLRITLKKRLGEDGVR
jgi:short-subunit dehydrogenase